MTFKFQGQGPGSGEASCALADDTNAPQSPYRREGKAYKRKHRRPWGWKLVKPCLRSRDTWGSLSQRLVISRPAIHRLKDVLGRGGLIPSLGGQESPILVDCFPALHQPRLPFGSIKRTHRLYSLGDSAVYYLAPSSNFPYLPFAFSPDLPNGTS